MGYHHLALATRDTSANHIFYTQAMGFDLVKVEIAGTPGGGWAKHFFYDTGGDGLMAFWELHDETLPEEFPTAMSEGAGLPPWVNHVAFSARDADDLAARRQRWLDHGYDVLEIDHNWCHSVYTVDPNGTMVEFCITTRDFSEEDRKQAAELLRDSSPALSKPPAMQKVYRTENKPVHVSAAG